MQAFSFLFSFYTPAISNFYETDYLFWVLFALDSCKIPTDYLHEAGIAEEKGDMKGAILILSKAIKKDPRFLPAYINRGVDEALMGNYQAAIDNYTGVIDISPKNTLALFNRAINKR